MKKILLFIFYIAVLNVLNTATLSAQEPLTYKTGLFKAGFYNGGNKLTKSATDSLMKNCGDPEVVRLWKQKQAFTWASNGAMIGGSTLMLIGIVKNVNTSSSQP